MICSSTTVPGIYEGISFEKYCRIPAMNASTLEWADVSMEHLKAAIDGRLGKEDTDSMLIGRAIHCLLLEPHRYEQEFWITAGCQGIKRSGEECGIRARFRDNDNKWYCGTHKTASSTEMKNVLSESMHQCVKGAVRRLKTHEVVKLLRQRGGAETTMICETDDELRKCRADKLIKELDGRHPPIILDVKKTPRGGAADHRFAESVRRYKYDMKAAWYLDIAIQLTGQKHEFIWIAVEEDYPYGVNVIQADRATLEIGRIKYESFWGKFLRAKQSDEWPGYSTAIHWGGLPEREKQYWEPLLRG